MPSLQPLAKTKWNRSTAKHLLNRAGFGIPYPFINELASMGMEAAVDRLVNYESLDDNLYEPDFIPSIIDRKEAKQALAGLTDEERRDLQNESRRMERDAVTQLQIWWMYAMRDTTRPLQEKMTLFWHGHFATSAQKVKIAKMNYDLNDLFRREATGNFKTLAYEVGRSPSMLIYLDNNVNRKGRPNENFARELMELFTLGIGNYTEKDIKEAARAFTGWTHAQDRFINLKRQHDTGKKKFLKRSGAFTGEDIYDVIFDQSACATFICRKLWEYFAYTNPDESIIEDLAATLRTSDYEIKPVLMKMFKSKAFYSAQAIGTQIQSPAQWVVRLWKHLDADLKDFTIIGFAMGIMGQSLLHPPNVKGWEGNRVWINTTSLLIRYNLTGYMLNGIRMVRKRKNSSIPVKTRPFFKPLDGLTVGAVVDILIDRLLSVPLDASQRTILIKTLKPKGKENDTFSLADTADAQLIAVLHLTVSTAESQLC